MSERPPFKEVAEKILNDIAITDSIPPEVLVGEESHKVVRIEGRDDMLLAHTLFYMAFYRAGLSGTVGFYRFDPPIFAVDGGEFELLIYVITHSNQLYNLNISKVVDAESVFKTVTPTTYGYGGRVYAFFYGRRDSVMRYFMFSGVQDEEAIIKTVLAAGRIARTASISAIPVIGVDGTPISVSPLGHEDEIFISVLNFLLRRMDLGYVAQR